MRAHKYDAENMQPISSSDTREYTWSWENGKSKGILKGHQT